jgi:hypothetical protein
MMTQFPRLHSFARNNKISVAHYLANTDIHHNFHTPISSEVAQELSALNQIMMNMQGNHQVRDKWTYIWGSEKYSSSRFYSLSFASTVAPTPFKWIWKSRVSKKIKIFIWLLFKDRINSRNLLRRKSYKIDGDDYSCPLHLKCRRTIYHLIFQCPFSYECWDYLGISWDHSLLFFDTIQKAKQDFSNNLFMEIFSMAAWEIWKQRNGKIFRGTPPKLSELERQFPGMLF